MVSGWPSRRDAAAAAAANVWAELAMHDCVQGTVQACECLPAVPTRAPPVQSSSHQCGKAERIPRLLQPAHLWATPRRH